MNEVKIAQALWNARIEGRTLSLDQSERPSSLEDAYTILQAQEALGGPIAGWKIGAGAPGGMAMLGLGEPFVGPVHEQFIVESGSSLTISPEQAPGLETEFMVRLAEDLPARAQPYTGKEVAKATATVCPAFEIVAQRVPGPLENNGLLVIADGAAHQAVVVGKPSADWTSFDLARAPVRTSVDDKELGAGDFGPMLWEDPLAAVGWLATHPYLAGRGLRAGEFVMTGTCTGLILDITPGQKAVGDFGDFGAVMVRFS